MAGGRITVTKSVTGTLVVTITRASGGALTVYSDAALTSSVSMPHSISASTTYYLANDDFYVLSVTRNGIEIANTPNGTRTVQIKENQALSVEPLVDYVNVEAGTEGADLVADNAFSGTNTFSGRTRIAAGTALLPSITPTGDTNTGYWAPAADVLAESVGGNEITRTNASGFGVLKTPTVPLDVLGAAAISGTATANALVSTTSVTAASAAITNGVTAATVVTTGAVTIPAGAVGTPSLTTTGDTNTGVYFPAADSVALATAGVARATVDSAGLITVGTSGIVALQPGAEATPSLIPTGDANTGVWFPAADTVALSTAGSERLRVDSAGDVGIGVADPLKPLHVKGVIRTERADDAAQYIELESVGGEAKLSSVGTILTVQSAGASLRFNVNGSTERMRIDSNGLVTGTGTSLGAWTSFTPTLTGFDPGNGTYSGGYSQVGKIVRWRARFTFGTTSAAAASVITLALPVTAVDASHLPVLSSFYDLSTTTYYGAVGEYTSTTTVSLSIPGTNGVFTTPSTTLPFVWATGDIIYASGTYEAA